MLAVVAVGCGQQKPITQEPDETPDAAVEFRCDSSEQCQLGQRCEQGACFEGSLLFDAGFFCTRDEDCVPAEWCVRSKGECWQRPIVDAQGDAGAPPACTPGEESSCGVAKLGECRLGVSTCVSSGESWAPSACMGNVDPDVEVCDGLDNNCDGVVDDGQPVVSCGVVEVATGESSNPMIATSSGTR